jgi:hypothetical protein
MQVKWRSDAAQEIESKDFKLFQIVNLETGWQEPALIRSPAETLGKKRPVRRASESIPRFGTTLIVKEQVHRSVPDVALEFEILWRGIGWQ